MFSIASTAQSQIAGGTVRGIGVTSLESSPLVPGLPAIAQSGLADFEVIGWNGFVTPKDTPSPVIAKISSAIPAGLEAAGLPSQMNTAGYGPAAFNTPAEFAKFIAADTEKWAQLAAKINMKGN